MKTSTSILLGVSLALFLSGTAVAGPKAGPIHLPVSMQGLPGWQELYLRWYYGGLTLPAHDNGNAVVGNVVLMPLPSTPDGHLDVTLDAGQSWVLALLGLGSTTYTDGTPPDQFLDPSILSTAEITFQVDDQTIVETSNVMSFYSQAEFDPPIPFLFPPLAAIIWFQDIGVVEHPFSVGTHTMRLDARTTQALPANFGGGFLEFHQTWTITVKPQ